MLKFGIKRATLTGERKAATIILLIGIIVGIGE